MKLALALAILVPVGSSAATVESVLARMDSAAESFRGMTAKIRKISYTQIIKESNEESGGILLRSPKPRTVNALITFDKPDLKSIAFREKKVQIFLPKINTVQEYDLGKFDALLTQGLLLGFATSSRDLKKNYKVAFGGEETVSGKKTAKLELTPLTEAIKQHLTKLDLWIAEDDGQPVQQKLYQKSGDYTQIVYSDMKLDATLTDEQVRLKLPANVKKEFPQK